jgi:arsenate reductase
MELLKTVKEKIIKLLEVENSISEERKKLLLSLAKYISVKIDKGERINLIFICTHNSRRSTMSQIWAETAAEYFSIPNIQCYSGGTEATAFNPRAVKAVKDSGFKIEQIGKFNNPIYLVTYSDKQIPIKCFSKIYSDSFNPQKDFVAIMTCSDADKNCPIVFGAEARFPIRYDDPKKYDGTDVEEIKYVERFEQIGIEMLFLFEKIKPQIVRK